MSTLELGAELGRGGMGVVYEAFDEELERTVAVKVALATRAQPQLVREARVCGGLEHPNVVPIYDLQDGPRLVMQRVEGQPWSALLRAPAGTARPPLTPDEVERHLDIFLKVCDAVSLAHTQGIVHRDLKPENVMVGPDGEVYVLDWALAVSLGHGLGARLDLPRAADVSRVSGTPAYMPPEQALGIGPACGPTLDVFALGACLAEVFSGEPIRQGTLRDVLVAAAEGRPFPLASEVPHGLGDVIRQATAAAPEARYPSVRALQEAVRTWRERRAARTLLAVAEEVRERLDARASSVDGRDTLAETLVSEARFAYQQVLDAWPASEVARRGLGQVLRLGVMLAIERQDVEAARAGLAELDDAPGLARALRQLEARVARSEGRKRALRDLARRQDHRIGAGLRNALAILLAMVVTIGAGGVVAWETSLGAPDLAARALALGWCTLGGWVAALVLAARYRRSVNRQVAGFSAWILLAVDGAYAWTVATGWSAHEAPALIASLVAAMLVGAGVSVEPRMLAPAALCALTAVACALMPPLSTVFLGLGAALALVAYAVAPVQDPMRIVVRQRG